MGRDVYKDLRGGGAESACVDHDGQGGTEERRTGQTDGTEEGPGGVGWRTLYLELSTSSPTRLVTRRGDLPLLLRGCEGLPWVYPRTRFDVDLVTSWTGTSQCTAPRPLPEPSVSVYPYLPDRERTGHHS